ncbi:hypothetical protein B0H17DRAFT_931338, partial [Mycena rosella]
SQGIQICAPFNGTTVKAGSKIIVEVDRPDTLTPSTEVAIVIGFRPCFEGYCTSPLDAIDSHGLPHQNFTVTIPSFASAGTAQLSVIYLSLVLIGPFPLFQFRNITVMVK